MADATFVLLDLCLELSDDTGVTLQDEADWSLEQMPMEAMESTLYFYHEPCWISKLHHQQ